MWPTVEDFGNYLQQEIALEQEASAELALNLAAGAIRGEARQVFDRVEDDEVVLKRTMNGILLLPELPVEEVSVVTEEDINLVDVTDFTWSEFGILERAGRVWLPPVSVTYTHGFAEIPDDVRGLCLAIAARTFGNPEGLPREQMSSYAISYPQAAFNLGATVQLTDPEKRMLDRYRP